MQDENFEVKHTEPGLLSMVRVTLLMRVVYLFMDADVHVGELRCKHQWMSSEYCTALSGTSPRPR